MPMVGDQRDYQETRKLIFTKEGAFIYAPDEHRWHPLYCNKTRSEQVAAKKTNCPKRMVAGYKNQMAE